MIKILLDFLNNNLGIITLFVGSFVVGLYIRQKKDYKREIAKLILQEIRYAERQIKIARERGNVFLLSNTLLPTNSWYSNVHLFVSDLEETDRDSISDFYSKTAFLDKVITEITEYKINKIVPVPITKTPTQPILTPPGGSITVALQGGGAAPLQEVVVQQYQLSAEIILNEVAGQIEFLYNTPAADKLRALSRRKWNQI